MNIAKVSFVITAVAVVLASVNMIIRATQNEASMLPALLLLVFTVCSFVFSLIILNGSQKKDKDIPKDNDDE